MTYFQIIPSLMFAEVNFANDYSQQARRYSLPMADFYEWVGLVRACHLTDAYKSRLLGLRPPCVEAFDSADIGRIRFNIHIFSRLMRDVIEYTELSEHLYFVPVPIFIRDSIQDKFYEDTFYAVHYSEYLWRTCLKVVPAYKAKEFWFPSPEKEEGVRRRLYDTGNALLILDRKALGDVKLCRVANEAMESLVVREDVLDYWLEQGVSGFEFVEVLLD